MSRSSAVVVAAVAAAALVGALAVPAAAAPARHRAAPRTQQAAPAHKPGSYVPVTQYRAVPASTVLAAGRTHTVRLAGTHGIPADAGAVAITVHAISPRADGTLTAVPGGSTAPKAITVSYQSGQTTSQPTVTRLANGSVTIVNRARSGSTHLAVDVVGYYAGGTVGRTLPGELHTLRAPARVLDTRGATALRAHGVRTLQVAHGVPTSGVGGVAVALTTFTPAAGGSLIAYAAGNDQPTSPSASFAVHRTSTTFAWVPTRSDGSISIANTAGKAVDVAVDVVGWIDSGVARQEGALQPRFPARLVDHSPLLSGRTRTVPVGGDGGVPLAGVRAAVVELTASGATRTGSLAAWPAGNEPMTRALDYVPGRTSSSLAVVPLSAGALRIKNESSGSLQLTVDVVGFVLGDTLTPPPTSISRYLGDLTGGDGDIQTMQDHGCADAQALARSGSRFVLLDVGAQTVTSDKTSDVSPANPGVALTETTQTVRLDYSQLRDRLQSYLDAFATCGNGENATIAVGTNNDGAWNKSKDGVAYYAPAARGADWASSVINLLSGDNGITLAGASDIEPDFLAATQTQALTWEKYYLQSVTDGRNQFYFNGSADGCPDGFGTTNAACDNGYTQQGLYELAHYNAQVVALPQIYGPSMAAQWANIDRTGGGNIAFGGALTEHALAPETYTAPNGWAALYFAVGTLTSTPVLPAVSDITNG